VRSADSHHSIEKDTCTIRRYYYYRPHRSTTSVVTDTVCSYRPSSVVSWAYIYPLRTLAQSPPKDRGVMYVPVALCLGGFCPGIIMSWIPYPSPSPCLFYPLPLSLHFKSTGVSGTLPQQVQAESNREMIFCPIFS